MDRLAFTTTATIGQPSGLLILQRDSVIARDGHRAETVAHVAHVHLQGRACRPLVTNHQSGPQVPKTLGS
jgi:hypothetical protein